MEIFNYNPSQVFVDSSGYPEPNNESEVREQFTRPLLQIREYLNARMPMEGNDVIDFRVNDGYLEYTKDHETWTILGKYDDTEVRALIEANRQSIETNAAAIVTEKTRAEGEENSLSERISSERTRAMMREFELDSAITAGDSAVESKLNTAKSELDVKITTNRYNITEEISRAKNAEGKLGDRITSQSLIIANYRNEATEGINNANERIDQEIQRATNREGLIENALSAEAESSQERDTALDGKITLVNEALNEKVLGFDSEGYLIIGLERE